MPDVLFKCPRCAKHLAADAAGVGLSLPCTDCELPVPVPKPTVMHRCPHCTADLCSPRALAGETFQCPNCERELIVPQRSTHYFGLYMPLAAPTNRCMA